MDLLSNARVVGTQACPKNTDNLEGYQLLYSFTHLYQVCCKTKLPTSRTTELDQGDQA